MTKEELIKQAKELYKNGECYSTFSLEEHLGRDLLVKNNIDIDKHRWYETSVSVFKCSDGLLGIRLPSQLYSESSEWSELYSGIEFYEVEEVMEVVYKLKDYEREVSINGEIYEEYPKVNGCLGCSLYMGTHFECEHLDIYCDSEDRDDGKDVIFKRKRK